MSIFIFYFICITILKFKLKTPTIHQRLYVLQTVKICFRSRKEINQFYFFTYFAHMLFLVNLEFT